LDFKEHEAKHEYDGMRNYAIENLEGVEQYLALAPIGGEEAEGEQMQNATGPRFGVTGGKEIRSRISSFFQS
jgi:hypothetical protein